MFLLVVEFIFIYFHEVLLNEKPVDIGNEIASLRAPVEEAVLRCASQHLDKCFVAVFHSKKFHGLCPLHRHLAHPRDGTGVIVEQLVKPREPLLFCFDKNQRIFLLLILPIISGFFAND